MRLIRDSANLRQIPFPRKHIKHYYTHTYTYTHINLYTTNSTFAGPVGNIIPNFPDFGMEFPHVHTP